jgi:hypothetical protein
VGEGWPCPGKDELKLCDGVGKPTPAAVAFWERFQLADQAALLSLRQVWMDDGHLPHHQEGQRADAAPAHGAPGAG